MMCKGIAVATAATLAALGLGIGASQAMPAPTGAGKVSFAGGCVFRSASLRVDRGVGLTKVEHVNAALAGTGVCSGTLDGQAVSETTSFLIAELAGRINCVDGTVGGPLTGTGRLEIAGKTIPVRVAFSASSLRLTDRIDLQGATSGTAGGDSMINNTGSGFPNNPSEGGIVGCVKGTMRQAVVDLQFQTASPLIGATPSPPLRATKPRLTASRQRLATVGRRGYVRVRCSVPTGATCAVRVVRRGTVLASGRTAAGRSVVNARLTRAGRRAVRRGGPLRVRVTGRVAGAKTLSQSLVLR